MIRHFLILGLVAIAIGLVISIVVLLLTGDEAAAPVQPGGWQQTLATLVAA